MHFGGGSYDLMKYKSKFSNNTIPYYIGRKVYNDNLYAELVNRTMKDMGIDHDCVSFFPKYRFISQWPARQETHSNGYSSEIAIEQIDLR